MLMLTQFAAFAPFLFPAQFADVTITVLSRSLGARWAKHSLCLLHRPNKQFCDAISSLLNFHSGNKSLANWCVYTGRLICVASRMNMKWRTTRSCGDKQIRNFLLPLGLWSVDFSEYISFTLYKSFKNQLCWNHKSCRVCVLLFVSLIFKEIKKKIITLL
jgi:hypothetical protein